MSTVDGAVDRYPYALNEQTARRPCYYQSNQDADYRVENVPAGEMDDYTRYHHSYRYESVGAI